MRARRRGKSTSGRRPAVGPRGSAASRMLGAAGDRTKQARARVNELGERACPMTSDTSRPGPLSPSTEMVEDPAGRWLKTCSPVSCLGDLS
eukprot:927640-Alexandrium_andersonii.AAC.1